VVFLLDILRILYYFYSPIEEADYFGVSAKKNEGENTRAEEFSLKRKLVCKIFLP